MDIKDKMLGKRDGFSDPQAEITMHKQSLIIEDFTDFLEWLFDHSGELDHITQPEAWELFKEWESKNEC